MLMILILDKDKTSIKSQANSIIPVLTHCSWMDSSTLIYWKGPFAT